MKSTLTVLTASALALVAGCSWESGVMTGAHMGVNAARKDLHLKVFLDDHPAEQNVAKKAATGYSRWKVSEAVATAPKLKFMIEKPKKFGRITMVSVAIHQQFEADYSHQAEYTIVSTSTDPEAQMKPDTVYDLGAMPPGFKIMNLTGQEVPKVDLKPGMKYQLVLTVRADHSETALVEFKT